MPGSGAHRGLTAGGAMAALVVSLAIVAPGSLRAQTTPQQPAPPQGAWATTEVPLACEKADFEAVVDGAAQTLRVIQQKQTPAFQAKLRALKEKRGWSHEQFLSEAARFVKDDRIAEFDEKSERLLLEINSTGDGGGKTPDCAVLAKLKAAMAALVETQNAKWAYMFQQVDAALAK